VNTERWRFLVQGPEAYNPSVGSEATADSSWGRRWTLGRDDGKQCSVEVEASSSALDAYNAGSLPATARRAIQSEGRSAVEGHLGDRSLPMRITITPTGVRRAH
jgi:hypothetical protein